jgi:hypothetical protein
VPPTVTPSYPDIGGLLRFAEPGATGGLLFLYAILLAATPVLDAALRRFGSVAVLSASAAIYALARGGAFGSHGALWPFPVAYWQPLFVVGYVLSPHLAGLHSRAGSIPRWWLAAISGVFAILFLLRNGVSIGLAASPVPPAWAFVKVPLSPAELLWYLAGTGFVLTWSAWAWGRVAWVAWALRWVSLLGRQSLLLYVSHLFVQLALIEALTLLDPTPFVRATMLPLMALILVGIGVAGEGLTCRPTASATALSVAIVPRRLPTTAITGSAVVVGSFLTVVTLQALIGTPATWNLVPSVTGGNEAASTAEVTTGPHTVLGL